MNAEEMTIQTQTQLVLEYLKQPGATLTRLEALKLGGGIELPGRIHTLRNQGHDIRTERVYGPGNRKCWARYTLIPPAPQTVQNTLEVTQ